MFVAGLRIARTIGIALGASFAGTSVIVGTLAAYGLLVYPLPYDTPRSAIFLLSMIVLAIMVAAIASSINRMVAPRRRPTSLLAMLAVLMIGFAVGSGGANALYGMLSGDSAEAGLASALACEQDASMFIGYPLVYAGREVLGYELQGCRREKTPDLFAPDGTLYHAATDSFTFVYGRCQIPEGVRSCPVPVAIIVYPACEEPIFPGVITGTVKVRGAPAYVKNDGSLRLELPTHTLTIYGPGSTFVERQGNARAIAGLLVPANELASALTAQSPLSTALGPAAVCP
ncbi:MAG: hypothetical protein WEB52_12365 [Dehalococcoidia bacterium]